MAFGIAGRLCSLALGARVDFWLPDLRSAGCAVYPGRQEQSGKVDEAIYRLEDLAGAILTILLLRPDPSLDLDAGVLGDPEL